MRRNWVLNKRHYPPHASRLSPAQVLEDEYCICHRPTGVEAAARLATTPFAAEEFPDYQEATVTEVLRAFGRRGGEAGAKRNVSVRIACASLGVPTYFASGRAQGVSMREFAAASARLQVLDALPAGATREQRRAALDKVADAFKCAGADGLKRHFVDAHPKKGKRSLAAQHEHDEAYLRLGGHTLQTLREREAAPRRRRLTEEDRRRRREELFPELVGRGPPAEARNAFDQTCIDLRLESAPEALRAAMVRGRVAANAFDPSLLSGFPFQAPGPPAS